MLQFPVAGFRWTTQFEPNPLYSSQQRHSPSWGPWLIPAEGPGSTATREVWHQRYPVFTDRRSSELHRRFARLARFGPDDLREPILDFANKYGWLSAPSERFWLAPRNQKRQSNLDWPFGESIQFWRSAIYKTASLVSLWDLLRDERRDVLAKFVVASGSPRRVGVYAAWRDGRLTTNRDFIGNDWRPITYGAEMEPEPVAEEGTPLGDGRFQSFPGISGQNPDVLAVTRLYLFDKVGETLHGKASPLLSPERPSGEAFLLQPHSLLAAIYLYFAREITGRRAPGTPCGNPLCDRTIDPSHGRRYCDDRCRDQARYYRDSKKRRRPRRAQSADNAPVHTPTATNSGEC